MTLRNQNRNVVRKSSERGIFLVFWAILLSTVIFLVAYAVSTGLLTLANERAQNSANIAAMACMEGFMNNPEGTSYQQRAAACLAKANSFVLENKIPGADGNSVVLALDTDPMNLELPTHSVVRLGKYFSSDTAPDRDDDPCPDEDSTPTNDFPCFKPNPAPSDPSNDTANAARIILTNRDTSELGNSVGFAHIFGGQSLSRVASAAAVPKCVAFLMDISQSVAADNYLPIEKDAETGHTYTRPAPGMAALYALPSTVTTLGCPASGAPWSGEQYYWCNLDPTRPNQPMPAEKHYKSDYQNVATPFGSMLIDRYLTNNGSGPEPMRSIFLAFNAALRSMKEVSSGGDRAVLIPFSNKLRYPEPMEGLTQNLDNLIWLTNMDNANVSGQASYITKGWFPTMRESLGFPNDGNTNITLAVMEAISRLSSCPTNARKVIVLATDGLATCAASDPDSGSVPPRQDWYDGRGYRCGPGLGIFVDAEQELMRSIPMEELQKHDISVSVLLAGDNSTPHFINVPKEGHPGEFLTMEEARALGYGLEVDSPLSWVNGEARFNDVTSDAWGQYCYHAMPSTGEDENLYVWDRLPRKYSQFRRAGTYLASVAFSTGGRYCPLQKICDASKTDNNCFLESPDDSAGCNADPSPGFIELDRTDPKKKCYECPAPAQGNTVIPSSCRLKSAARRANDMQTCAIQFMTPAEQAAACVREAVLQDPVQLISERVPQVQ